MRSKQFRVVSAGVGAGAVIAMGALGVAFSNVSAAEEPEPAPPGPVTTSQMSTAATVVDGTEMDGPGTSIAVPDISTPPSSFDQQPPD